MLMHETRHKLADEVNRIKAEAIKAFAIHSNGILVAAIKAADDLHESAMEQANGTLLDFIERMQTSPAEIIGWARPHLENLNNSVLGVVQPNGFPQDHQRLTHQYRAVFQQRLDIMLRNVEIGLVRGSRFTQAEKMEAQEEWISAAQALHLLATAFESKITAQMVICQRAHANMIRARAEQFIIDDKPSGPRNVPKEFWWAEGNEALTQNWTMGDFETYIQDKRYRAFGVKFASQDIAKMVPSSSQPVTPKPTLPTANAKIFLVHGRDDATKNEVALFLGMIGLQPVILHMRPNGGRHLLTKFQEESEGAEFAVVLMTPDDEGGIAGSGAHRPRARQNVVFELGFFIGKLGPSKVAALLKGNVEKPSDFDGIAYISLCGDWKRDLARELHHAKVSFDAAKALSA
ncbi:hypothetical protein GCM10010987_12340 [Bradyrhizobium guangdongense]|uniref:CD-NTase-associated protein 12/Pycsar effector protein TIR domain-containing protein n=2 Tax=Bradyrhizobium guangdongense TaxID=1325090 RepID=A0A410V0F7_9BRAD|nr:hypothetical protein X265_05180 [Bradyrhizobium guangdongense]QOZ58199.1 hypothetical protein XH86_05175 [Bradyrhizobium guangdongense]GGI21031.1 hypothetical protein GCM10010987_12340 [Bradyrhizobium guangdongense]